MKFKNYIETESGIKDTSTSPGTAGQVLSSTVTGTSWIDPDTLEAAASKLVVIACKNVSGVPILKGTPVYQSGTVGATDVIEVEPADATISTGYLPAIGILQTTLNNNGIGNVVITGEFLNYSTADIPTDRPGGDPFTGDTVYLAVGGGLTCIKPTGAGNAIQNLGLIGKVSGGSAGSITVSSIMRANDVPNLPTGRIWIGDGNTIVSDTVYVDDPNSSLIVNGTTLQTTEALSVIGAGYFSDKVSIGTAASTVPGNNSYTLNLLDLNSVIAFGDNSQSTQNVIVGEFGSTDTDQLWLHGKNGTIFSHDGDVNEAISIAGVIDSIGNFGIGTTTPALKLEVEGSDGLLQLSTTSSTGNPYISFAQAGGRRSYIQHSDGGDYLKLASEYGGISFFTGSGGSETQKMVINNVGDIGMGTATLNSISTEVTTLSLGSTSTSISGGIAFQVSGGVVKAYNYVNSSYLYSQTVPGVGQIFYGAGSERMRIHNTTGNVGIGTSTPAEKLEVNGNIRLKDDNQIYFGSSGSVPYWTIGVDNTTNNDFEITGQQFYSGDRNILLNPVNNGNVGIGITAPNEKLDVAGVIRSVYQPAPLAGGTVIGKTLSYAISPYGIVYRGYVNGLNSIQVEREANPSETFDLALQPTGGNVGVGTTAPDSNLEVAGSTGSNTVLHVRNDSTGSTRLKLSNATDTNVNGFQIINNAFNGSVNLINYKATTLALWTNGSQRLTILSNGNVGIGATAPRTKLHVSGLTGDDDPALGSSTAPLFVSNTANSYGLNIGVNNSGTSWLQAQSNTSATPYNMSLNPLGGNVGIGTTGPIYELDVVGDIRARGNGTGNIYSGTFGARLSNYYSFLTTNSEFRVGYANAGGYSVCRASAFTVSSDYRLKEKIVTLTDPLDRLRQLNVYKFNWIDKPNEKAVDGFIAHEVAEVIPEAVVGVKDEIGIDGKPEYQGIDQAKIVPLLTAALQEAIKKIENLEERINLIENK